MPGGGRDLCAKAVKLANAAMTSCELTAAAAACCKRLGSKVLKLPSGSEAQQEAHAAYEAATAHHQVALNDMDAAVAAAAAAHAAMVASSEARYAAEAAEAVDAESEGEEVWVG